MRRPDPLPSAPRTRTDDRAETDRRERMSKLGIDDAAAVDRADSAADATDTAPIPVIDVATDEEKSPRRTAPWRRRRRDAEDPTENDSEPAAEESEEPATAGGWRDVWQAARARRRVMRAEVRRFTVRQRRRRRVWIISLSALVLLIIGSVGAAYSPLFTVRDVAVVGADQLDVKAVSKALADQLGTPLPLVDRSAIKSALVEFPLIETYQVEAHPPHELVIRIVERTPVGVVTSDAGFTTVDAAGVALWTTEEQPDGLPVIDAGATGGAAFAAVGQVLRSLPDDLALQVSSASATTAEDVTLTLADTGTQVFWGSADDSAKKAMTLLAGMVNIPPDSVSVYDVSAPGSLFTR
ncbi:MAG: FtsQ-type POTRA domain-containing protein [Microbacterium sp.]